MMQVQEQAPKIETLLDASNSLYQDLLGYKPEQTKLQEIPENQWNEFGETRGLNSSSSGIYLPRNQTSIIQEGNLLSLFHEYFGHGLYCEQSLRGRKLVDLEKRLLAEEKREFQGRLFTLEDVQGFRERNKTFQKLNDFRRKNLARYELFAIWTEYLLSGEFGLKEMFEIKYNSLSEQNKKQIEDLASFNQQYRDLATFYSFGLARRTTTERVKRLLGDMCKDKLKDVRFALLYGSKNEFSDIDIFIVSDSLSQVFDSWLDVRVYNLEEFNHGIKMFDVAITDPLLTGDFILGDRNYFHDSIRRLFNQEITKETIGHNLTKSKEQKELALRCPANSYKHLHGLRYSLAYLKNALFLKDGKRILTKKDLLSYSRRASAEDDKPPQSEGGETDNAT